MRRDRQAKIVATLGPASSNADVIRQLFLAGADVFRFNFSHGSHDEHGRRCEIVRQIERETGRPIAVMADLQGPKIRLGDMADGATTLRQGAEIELELAAISTGEGRLPIPHREVFSALSPGVSLLVDDGKLRLEVVAARETTATARVLIGGQALPRKGLSVIGATLPVSALTEKDQADLAFALDMGADWIALSFVQRADDIASARALTKRPISIITKLEKPVAIEHLDAIVAQSDAIMIARGDLGVELPPHKVPVIQRQILRTCRKLGKPVVVATQMLESMIASPIPTRAEASDVATAIYDGADAVMLSAESAAGNFPVEAVRMMDQIICEVERDPHYRSVIDAAHPEAESTISDVICDALRKASSILSLAAVVTYTATGKTALRAARERPTSPILALTPNLGLARQLALVWGVYAVNSWKIGAPPDLVDMAFAVAEREGLLASASTIAIAGGMPFGIAGGTNLLRIAHR
jgi:pyruvate kinase